MKILLLITTYDRPKLLLRLLKELKSDQLSDNVHLLIYNDGSTLNYQKVISYLNDNFSFDYFLNETNYGKSAYYRIINAAYQNVRNFQFDYFLQLPDDVRLVDDFFTKCLDSFERIEDDKKVCLNIWNDYSRFKKRCWTPVQTTEVEFNDLKFHKIGWLDMCFVAKRKFFEFINYSVHRPINMYLYDKEKSSGVGAQLSKILVDAGANLYQVAKSLVIHNGHASVMHPEHRVKTPLITNHETVTASMATIPSRVEALREVVGSIIDQVDQLNIYLNEFNHTPHFLNHSKITYSHSSKELGDLGDAGKFFSAEKINGYHFTIDDDLIYPGDYMKIMIHAIERLQRKVIVTQHGRKFHQKPIKSYYHGAETRISCLNYWDSEMEIDVPGTGVMAYHTDTIQFDVRDFKASNMADIWAAKKAMAEKVKVMVLSHKAGWIKHSRKINMADTIYASQNKKDAFQTKIINSFL